MKRQNTLLPLFLFLVMTSIAQAQFVTEYTFSGDSAGDTMGYSVSDAGDVNGDGFSDVIAGAHTDDNNGTDSGSARVYSGSDGSILYTFSGDMAGDNFGFSVSGAGDVNGDGFADVIVGARMADINGSNSGSVRVFSGADGSILYTFHGNNPGDWFGHSVSGTGDVNGDGFADFVVGAPRDNIILSDIGTARVFSGFDGSILHLFAGDNSGDDFGFSVSGAGDVNSDGIADVIVGAIYDDNNGLDSGSARVFSGLDGSILFTLNGDSSFDEFGNSVSDAGDVNGDGFADVIVGAAKDLFDKGSAQVFSGFDGSVLYSFIGDQFGDQLGNSVNSAGDIDCDGFDDVIVGVVGEDDNGAQSGSARVFSGLDGSILHIFNGDNSNDGFGVSVSAAGDVNGDGLSDIVVGASGDDNNGADSGSVRVFVSEPTQALNLYTFNGDNAGDLLGRSVSGAGDVNGDGFDDFIAGAPDDETNGSQSGIARVFSGFDGSVLYTFNGNNPTEAFGFSVSGGGDVNGDGFADVIVGSPFEDHNGASSGSVRVFSGADGSILYTFHGDSAGDIMGTSVSDAGDVNGDGFSDVIAGAYRDDNNGTNSGMVRVYSGLDGSILYAINGDDTSDHLGLSVSGAGDVNGDGFDDFVAGARDDDNNGSSSGSARVYSGLDGSILYTFNGDSANDQFGESVSRAGDVNGDGFDDVIVGARQDDNNGSDSGIARVFSGFDGNILYTFQGAGADHYFGDSVSDAGDVNGDGFADVMVGATQTNENGADSGSVQIFSGGDGSILYTFKGSNAGDRFGHSVSGAGDVNGDGMADMIVGALFADNAGTDSGSVYVFKSALAPAAPTGQAPQGGLAVFDINNATNVFGVPVDSNVVTSAANGPYATSVAAGDPITFSWGGVPNTGVICMFGPRNDAIVNFPGVGQFDIGSFPITGTGLPNSLFVFGDFNLAIASFHHAQFFCGPAGTGFVSYQLSPLFIPGYLTRFQCVMNPNGMFHMSNAVDVTVL